MSAFEKVFDGQQTKRGIVLCSLVCQKAKVGPPGGLSWCASEQTEYRHATPGAPCWVWADWAVRELEEARSTAAAALKVIGTSVPSAHEVREREMASCEHEYRWIDAARYGTLPACLKCGKVRLVRRVTGAAEDPAWRELADQARPDLDRWDAEAGR